MIGRTTTDARFSVHSRPDLLGGDCAAYQSGRGRWLLPKPHKITTIKLDASDHPSYKSGRKQFDAVVGDSAGFLRGGSRAKESNPRAETFRTDGAGRQRQVHGGQAGEARRITCYTSRRSCRWKTGDALADGRATVHITGAVRPASAMGDSDMAAGVFNGCTKTRCSAAITLP